MCLVSHWNIIFTFTTTSFAPFFWGRFLWITPGDGLRPTTTSGVADFLCWTGFAFCGAFDWPELWLGEGWWSGSGDLRIGFGFGTLKIIGCTGATDGAGSLLKGLSSKRNLYQCEIIGITHEDWNFWCCSDESWHAPLLGWSPSFPDQQSLISSANKFTREGMLWI